MQDTDCKMKRYFSLHMLIEHEGLIIFSPKFGADISRHILTGAGPSLMHLLFIKRSYVDSRLVRKLEKRLYSIILLSLLRGICRYHINRISLNPIREILTV